ncbi:hypothetical protein ABZ723_04195 [Streptomyces sp. NPDC006700]|uniref:hypothetical protein n=1 Tax=Streptomyces sp. NPDC006700 TaxID=3154479 RepID=UPI0033D9300C
MSADEIRDQSAAASLVPEGKGPRHAAPKKALFTRLHVPSGKAIALAAMPTAVLIGMGFTPTLALADGNDTAPPSKSLTADEYKDCLAAIGDAEKDDASASPTPSPTASEGASPGQASVVEPGSSAPAGADRGANAGTDEGSSSSSDSGSGDRDEPAPTRSATAGGKASGEQDEPASAPSASARGGGLLGTIGDTLGSVLTGGKPASGSGASSGSEATPPSSATATPSASETKDTASGSAGNSASGTVNDTVQKVTDTVKETVKDTTGTVSGTAGDAGKAVTDVKAVKDVADAPTASPSPSAGSTTDPEGCPAATDAVGGVDNKVLLADVPWHLDASSLLLKGADYQGVVEVRTANGTVKRVLKYVISDGTDIGDLHQTVKDKQAGKTYHVQAAKGSTSTIRNGDTVMYTESISGNLFGLIPVTFSPKSPPPLNIPLIYFTKVKVVQAAQFGGDLHIPGMRVYTTD